jgi:hypothetical protein
MPKVIPPGARHSGNMRYPNTFPINSNQGFRGWVRVLLALAVLILGQMAVWP